MSATTPQLALEGITQRIFVLRAQKVLLDSDLAALYGVDTRRLNEQVRRNRDRFPQDFIFELTREEFDNLKSQFATSSWGGAESCRWRSPSTVPSWPPPS
ncbi:MAG: ORF6N domain-containing protein [Burkholderiaceae bacterium]